MRATKTLSYMFCTILISANLQSLAQPGPGTKSTEAQNPSNNQGFQASGQTGQTGYRGPIEKANQTGDPYLDIETGNELLRETVPYNDANINRGYSEQDYTEPYKFIDAEEW